MQFKTLKKVVLAGAIILSSVWAGSTAEAGSSKKEVGKEAYAHTYYLSEKIGQRVAGSENETKAGSYISSQLKKMGYKVSKQEFTYEREDKSTVTSNNILVVKKGKSEKQIIVGAHYDSVNIGKGADDNASSVGVILETAKNLKSKTLPYTIKFVFFGAEEEGLRGSKHYVSKMSQKDIKNTIGMINLDSLLAGDNIYVYGGKKDNGFIRDLALDIAKKKKIPLTTNPGVNPKYPAGTTGDWSDHAPFQKAGIPIGYFEATNWELGDKDGYTQTVKHGEIWHTENDNLAFLEKEFPGRVDTHLKQFTTVLTEVLTKIKK